MEDHRSVNGTFVNGELVMGTAPLESGDELMFDTFRFNFVVIPADHVGGGDDDPRLDVDQTQFRAPEFALLPLPIMLERVLYIDDDEAMTELAELVLEAADIEMMPCSPGPDALQLAEAFAPKLILLDWMARPHP